MTLVSLNTLTFASLLSVSTGV